MSSKEMRFDDDVVIVTGAGRGLGRAYALLFAERGASVVVNDLDEAVAQEVVEEIKRTGGKAVADSHSVADAQSAQGIVDTALKAFGTVTVLVNNAGIITYSSFADLDDRLWRSMNSVTLDGTYFVSKAVWPVFAKNSYGRIVNVTSNAGFAGTPTLSHYGTAKLGVAGLTKNLAHEGAEHGIKVNAIAPMAVTRMNAEAFFGNAKPREDTWQDDITSGLVPMGPASIVAPTTLWLAHRTTDITGEIFSTSSGKVGRVAFIVGDGYFNPNHTPEDLRDNIDKIRDLSAYLEPVQVMDELAAIPPLFQGS